MLISLFYGYDKKAASALCTMHYALCTMHFALCTMHCPLCTLVRRGERQMWSGTRPGCLLITGEQPALFTRSKSKRSSTTSTTSTPTTTTTTTTTTCPNGAAPAHLVTPHHTTSSAPRREPRTHREHIEHRIVPHNENICATGSD